MKKLVVTMLLLPLLGFAQIIENVDYIAPFHNDAAAVKKGDKWGFMDKQGALLIDFRDDLVSTQIDDGAYPIFSGERCLISRDKDGIAYFGYIDKTGKAVIEPQFLNAANFKGDNAIVLKLVKDQLGSNELMKNVVSYHYFEVIIDKDGEVDQFLSEDPVHITLTKEKMKDKPVITSEFISDNLVAIRNNNKTWTLKKIKE
jgi:hypothetical protein